MKRFWNYVLHAAGAAAIVIAALYVAGLAVPFLADSLRAIRSALPSRGGDTGLIFVESPEVYTRQRLVNDRYLQDAWLRRKLDNIDTPGGILIDTVRVRDESSGVALNTPLPDRTIAGLPSAADAPVSIANEFELQSNVRDAIRQMILENALDDRHDLSGNTVFGLKFDTAVLPASRTERNPTVIVRMETNPLENLSQSPQVLVPYFNRSAWSDLGEISAEDAALLRDNDRFLDAWRLSLEDRLNGRRRAEAARILECSRPQQINEALLGEPFCAGDPEEAFVDAAAGRPLLVDGAQARLVTLLAQGPAVDNSLASVMRVPERNLSIGRGLEKRYRSEAQWYCEQPDNQARSLRDFIASRQRTAFPLPAPWDMFFDILISPRVSDKDTSCGLELDIELVPLTIRFLIVPRERVDPAALFALDLRPVPCNASICANGAVTIWAPSGQSSAAASTLDRETIEALVPDPSILESVALCFGDGYYYEASPDGAGGADEHCGPGLIANYRAGAYQFLRRIVEVESYTYAAFPKGDVSGVVTEAGLGRSATVNLDTPAGQAGFALGQSEREQVVEAVPAIMNFASGDRGEFFDFGWSIVKEGFKTPMIASQLVLVSVPAYLSEIRLEIITGFLDLDQVPSEWARQFGPGGTSPDRKTVELEDRFGELLTGWRRSTLHVSVPGDYEAIDAIMVGSITGPEISASPLAQGDCHRVGADSRISIAIEGERLWRSTVVTLAGRTASQIEVMPDMRGIVATFDEPAPEDPDKATGEMRHRDLVVWTSEGHTPPTRIPVCPR